MFVAGWARVGLGLATLLLNKCSLVFLLVNCMTEKLFSYSVIIFALIDSSTAKNFGRILVLNKNLPENFRRWKFSGHEVVRVL